MKVELVQHTPEIFETIAQIASICYDSAPKDALKMAQQLYDSGHHSVFEHIYFTWKIEGISRAASHQLVRHRMCSFTQRSQRYCDEDGFKFVEPPSVSDGMMSSPYFNASMETVGNEYRTLANNLNVPKEDARYVLPNACETSLYMSCNLRELIHIANERLCSRAQWEIRALVEMMCDRVIEIEPELTHWLVPKCEANIAFCPEARGCGKYPRLMEVLKNAGK